MAFCSEGSRPGNPGVVGMLQAWTYKKFGFPVPYLVVGRWGITPFPSKAPLKFIVGSPISVPENPLGEKVRSDDSLCTRHLHGVLHTTVLQKSVLLRKGEPHARCRCPGCLNAPHVSSATLFVGLGADVLFNSRVSIWCLLCSQTRRM